MLTRRVLAGQDLEDQMSVLLGIAAGVVALTALVIVLSTSNLVDQK